MVSSSMYVVYDRQKHKLISNINLDQNEAHTN